MSSVSNDPSARGATASSPTAPTIDQLERSRQEDEWRGDLARLEYEIQTLKNVLAAKTREANELKRKLGITSIGEMKEDLKHGIQTVKESEAFQKTNVALRSFGDFASRKMSDLRNSNAFKSVEGKVGDAYTSVKSKVRSSKSENSFEDALNQNSPTSPDGDGFGGKLPEDKVPL